MLRVLRRRDFALLWTGGLVSIAGDWMLNAALPYYVYERTGSTVATAGMVVSELAPGVVAGTFAGAFVDRRDRRRILVAANLMQAATVCALLAVTQPALLWLVYVVAATQSLLAAFSVPAEGALLPALVPDHDLLAANALNALNNRLGRLAGAPVGAALLAWAGLGGVVLADAATFVFAALLVHAVARPPHVAATADAPGLLRDWLEGLRVVRADRQVVVLAAVLGLMTFGGTMLDPLQVAWVRDVLGRGPAVYAWLLWVHAGFGIGGTLLVGRYGDRLSPRQLMGWSSVIAGVSLLVRFDVPWLPLALALAAVTGVTSVAASVGVETLVQRSVRGEHRGRVYGALGANGALLSLAGAGLGGLCAERIGIVPMLDIASGLVLASGLVVLRAFRS